MPDCIIRGGSVVLEDRVHAACDVAIEDGRIQAVGAELPGGATEEIDARGLHVFPAVIDIHVHFNEPGRADWEGAASGSRALAAGGGAVFFDMPLNSTPCTVNALEFDRKHAALEAASIADFGIWGGLVPASIPHMDELAAAGVVGFKAFMCDSGLPEFPRADDDTLFEGLKHAARLGLPVAVHAENHELTAALSQRMPAHTVRDFLNSRPIVAEIDAIQRAALLAGEAGAKLHIVHISCGRGIVAAAEARAKGVDVSIETCAHYLYFTEEDMEKLGAIAKCAPPLRSAADQDELWAEVMRGAVDVVGSDHSPAPPDMKTGDFAKAWGGIAGVRSTLAVLLGRNLPLERIASLTASFPARRFAIPRKGSIRPGNDGDLTLVDLSQPHTLRRRQARPAIGEMTMYHLGSTRSAHRPDHLLQTPDTFVRTPMPGMEKCLAIVHAAPALGAKFTQYTAEFEAGGSLAASAQQRFVYVLEGEVDCPGHGPLTPGDFAYFPAGSGKLRAAPVPARAAIIEKPYQPLDGCPAPMFFTGSEKYIQPQLLMGDPNLEVRSFCPPGSAYDFAVNVMTYQPGATLPLVEIHVMEHGLLMLQGGGIYRLNDAWYPVTEGDFIWMGPYCPQWFGALGAVPAKYLIYKDWNR
jgi:allantoinase